MTTPQISKETWDAVLKNIREDTWEPYQEEVPQEDLLDLSRIEVGEQDTGPLYSIDDPDSEW